jgi:hypothetical protein
VTWVAALGGHGPLLHQLGTILLVLTIPLFICGAQCLDMAEQQEHRERQARLDANS